MRPPFSNCVFVTAILLAQFASASALHAARTCGEVALHAVPGGGPCPVWLVRAAGVLNCVLYPALTLFTLVLMVLVSVLLVRVLFRRW